MSIPIKRTTKSPLDVIKKYILKGIKHPVHIRVARRNILLRDSVSHFLPNSGAWLLSGWTQRHALLWHQSEEIFFFNISLNGNRTHNLSHLQSHFVLLRHDRPQKDFTYKSIKSSYIIIQFLSCKCIEISSVEWNDQNWDISIIINTNKVVLTIIIIIIYLI